jgi:D-serine deaminase-like pyridoxal phosphate-dependent protein
MLVDQEAFDANADIIFNHVKKTGKKLRPASKSIRVPWLMQRIQKRAGELLSGWMCFNVDEALQCLDAGLKSPLVAYPTCARADYEKLFQLRQNNRAIPILTIDSIEHLALIDSTSWPKSQLPLEISLDIDMSWHIGSAINIGVYRSPLRKVDDVLALIAEIKKRPYLKLVGLMGYEAHIASLGDRNPFHQLMNFPKQLIRWLSARQVRRWRASLAQALKQQGIPLQFFNGGGTGSLDSTCSEVAVTEYTAGSGFLQSHLFDYYQNNPRTPALLFALFVTRRPQAGVVTVHGGGYIASGEIGAEKAPVPYLPRGLEIFPMEGFGEVQTPLRLPAGVNLQLGDPVFCRPCKAGEIAEHFREYLIVSEGKVIERAKTYRETRAIDT